MTGTSISESQSADRAARLRGIRFLAEHALAAADAYALRVGPDGLVTIQGDEGTLQRLVQMLDAQPCDADEGMREWEAAVPFDGGTIRVELTETE